MRRTANLADNSLLELDLDLSVLNLADSIYSCIFGFRNTPLEALHTFLLGAYMYFLRDVMGRLSKSEIAACIAAFNFFGFSHRLSRDISCYYRSFVGRNGDAPCDRRC